MKEPRIADPRERGVLVDQAAGTESDDIIRDVPWNIDVALNYYQTNPEWLGPLYTGSHGGPSFAIAPKTQIFQVDLTNGLLPDENGVLQKVDHSNIHLLTMKYYVETIIHAIEPPSKPGKP